MMLDFIIPDTIECKRLLLLNLRRDKNEIKSKKYYRKCTDLGKAWL